MPRALLSLLVLLGASLGGCGSTRPGLAPYRVVDLGLQGSGRALRIAEDGRVLFSPPDEPGALHARYAIADPGTGAVQLLAPYPTDFVAASADLDTLYVGEGPAGCADFDVRVRRASGAELSLGAPPTHLEQPGCAGPPPLPIGLANGHALVVAPAGAGRPHGFLWSPGPGFRDLGTLGGNQTLPVAVNDEGHVVGRSSIDANDHTPTFHPFLYREGTLRDMTADWQDAVPAAISAGDRVALQQLYGPAGTPHMLVWADGALHDVGLHPSADSVIALAQDDAGELAGEMAFSLDLGPPRAFVWSAGTLHDLNALVSEHGLRLVSAGALSRNGHLAARAVDAQGAPHVVALLRQADPSAGGGTPEPSTGVVLARGQRASALALDAQRVYWVHQTGFAPERASLEVRAVDKAGGAVVTLAALQGVSTDLAVSDAWIYLTVRQCVDPACTATAGRLVRVAKGGGPAQVLAPGLGQVAVAGGEVYVYASEQCCTGRVLALHEAGGPVRVLRELDGEPSPGLAVDEGSVYVAHVPVNASGAVWALDRVAGTPRIVTQDAPALLRPERMSLAAGRLFFRSGDDVFSAPAQGGPTLLVNAPRPGGLRRDVDADARAVAWTQSPVLSWGSPAHKLGCLAQSAHDGSALACLDAGIDDYRAVRLDGDGVITARGDQIVRLPR